MGATSIDLTNYDAVIFDLDGVLIDSEPIHFATMQQILAAEGRDVDAATYSLYVGMSLEATWEDLCGRLRLRHPPTYYQEIYLPLIAEALSVPLDPRPGATGLVAVLQSTRKPFAVASSSKRAWVETSLRAIGLREAFAVVVSADDVTRAKPDPELFLRAAALLGVEPARCLVIEDSPHGVQAARAAGMDVVAVRTPQTAGQGFAEATLVVDGLEELIEG